MRLQTLREDVSEANPEPMHKSRVLYTSGKVRTMSSSYTDVILETVARMAYLARDIKSAAEPVGRPLHNRHYLRKHGAMAYCGQAKGKQ